MGAGGSPLWPESLVGSITHTQGFASAAVAPRTDCAGLGIDSEWTEGAEIAEETLDLILVPEERKLDRCSLTQTQFHWLMFSAKESLYKCLFPLEGSSLTFKDFRLEGLDLRTREFSARLTRELSSNIPASWRGRGQFEFSRGCVHTGIELPLHNLP